MGDRRAAEEVVFDGGVRLERLGLNAGDGDDADDVFSGAAAGEVVYGSGNALEDRSVGLGLAEALHELVADVRSVEIGEDQDVRLAGNR